MILPVIGTSSRLSIGTLPRLCDQLLTGLVHTDDGSEGVVRAFVDLQDVLHLPNKLGVGFGRDAPRLDQPGLELVFFSVRRMVSCETLSMWPSSINLSAKRRNVQRHRPAGGLPHARAIRWASCSPSSIRGRRGKGRRMRTPSRPPSTNERRIRWTVIAPRSRASLICWSDHAGPRSLQSAFNRMRPGQLARRRLAFGDERFQLVAFVNR